MPGDEERERAIYRFDAQAEVVCDGLFALLRSLERYDGATAAGPPATVAIVAQVDAVQQTRSPSLIARRRSWDL